MKKIILTSTIALLLVACNQENEGNMIWQGKWEAHWQTPPESYPGISDVDFTMNGFFEFKNDNVTVTAQGYPGCLFGVDTISHTQSWKVSNDSLFLFTDPEVMSITYKVNAISEDTIKLQLMEDIFVTLTK